MPVTPKNGVFKHLYLRSMSLRSFLGRCEDRLTLTFRFKRKIELMGKIAWDCNERSLDWFNLELMDKGKPSKTVSHI